MKMMNSSAIEMPSSKSVLKKLSKESWLFFDFEATLLKSSSPSSSSSFFPYFMLVAFEGGGLLRALSLLLTYPFVCIVGKELGMKIMVFVSFFGIRKDSLRVGTCVLPKFFLEDVGNEGFDVVMTSEKKIGVSELPKVMIEGFLREYIGVEGIVGRDLKVVNGFFVGLEEEMDFSCMKELLLVHKNTVAVGLVGCSSNNLLYQQVFQHCETVHLLPETEKKKWKMLPQEKYPKPLIFHDSRLVFRPTALATISMFMWLPFGFFLAVIRMTVGLLLPFKLSSAILAFTGTITVISKPKNTFTSSSKDIGILYVCNHRTLLDPLYIQLAIMKPISAVTYGMSRFSEMISSITTVRLTRECRADKKLVETMLSRSSNLVICPEGTTCREPFLLRFSPLFAEVTDDIVPVAINVQTNMFYGSTATGLKCLDPIFHFLNPRPIYFIKVLEKLQDSDTHGVGGKTKFDVASYVQGEIARTLGFKCTSLSRKDKYMALAGNEGIVTT